MRNLPNDTAVEAASERTPAKAGVQPLTNDSVPRPSPGYASSLPERRCILTGERADPALLVRLALSEAGELLPDVRAKAPGRGAWIGAGRTELETAIVKGKLKGALARAFKTSEIAIPADLPQRIEDALERAALDRLGLEARGGTLITGSEKIEKAARSGRVVDLLHAADAGADGNRKLDQAWRVGNDAEGGGARGLVLAASRTILSLALGRENVVHIAVTDRGAAARVREALARWHAFIGFESDGQPCETPSQGTSAAGAMTGAPAAGTNEGY